MGGQGGHICHFIGFVVHWLILSFIFFQQDEYDELLKFAVVVPQYDPSSMQQTLTDTRDSFYQKNGVQGTGFHGNPGSRNGNVTPTRETLISVSRERDGMILKRYHDTVKITLLIIIIYCIFLCNLFFFFFFSVILQKKTYMILF